MHSSNSLIFEELEERFAKQAQDFKRSRLCEKDKFDLIDFKHLIKEKVFFLTLLLISHVARPISVYLCMLSLSLHGGEPKAK